MYHETQAVKTEDKPGNVIYEAWEDLLSQQRLDNNGEKKSFILPAVRITTKLGMSSL